jgi:hydroxymethylbilane synthase
MSARPVGVAPVGAVPVDVAPVDVETAGVPALATPPAAPLRLATRRSPLAMAQSRMVGEQLAALTGRTLELVEVTTRGDVDNAPLSQIGGTGVFVVAVRQALVDGRADVAVHSLKDLPTAPDIRLHLVAIPPREDPRDALVARDGATLETLPPGARIGTGSPRRRAQIAVARPDLEIVDIRGNVDTRLARVTDDPDAGGLDAVVLAAAGLSRLGRLASVTELIDPERVMPAPGQGALAVEVRVADPGSAADVAAASATDPLTTDPRATEALTAALRSLDDPHTRAAVVAERSLLAALEAGCSAPIGALAEVEDGPEPTVHLRAVLARPDGSLVRMSRTGTVDQAELVGRHLAGEMLAERDAAGTHGASSPTRQSPTTGRGSTPASGPMAATGPTAQRGSSE